MAHPHRKNDGIPFVTIYNIQGRPKSQLDCQMEADEFDARLLRRIQRRSAPPPVAMKCPRYQRSLSAATYRRAGTSQRLARPSCQSTFMSVSPSVMSKRKFATPLGTDYSEVSLIHSHTPSAPNIFQVPHIPDSSQAILNYVRRRYQVKSAKSRLQFNLDTQEKSEYNDDDVSARSTTSHSESTLDDLHEFEHSKLTQRKLSKVSELQTKAIPGYMSEDRLGDDWTESWGNEKELDETERLEKLRMKSELKKNKKFLRKSSTSSNKRENYRRSKSNSLTNSLSQSQFGLPEIDVGEPEEEDKVNDVVKQEVSEYENQRKSSLAPNKYSNPLSDNSRSRKLSSSSAVSDCQVIQSLKPMYKLRRAIKTIILLMKATRSNVEQSKKNQDQYLTGEKPESPKKAKKIDLDFDLSFFLRKKEKTLGVDAIKVLKTHPKMRYEKDVQIAVEELKETVDAFGEFPVNMQESLVKVGWYEKYGAKRVIIRQNHAAQNFYFIISGKANVSIAKKNEKSGETYDALIAQLRKGNSFGELALMRGGKRNATVSSENETELLAVTRDDFIDIFMNLSTDTEPDHIKFLREVSMLNDNWPIGELPYDDTKICLITYFRKGTVLCRNSNECEWVYVIRTGTCSIIKDLPLVEDGLTRLKNNARFVDTIDPPLDEEDPPGMKTEFNKEIQSKVFSDERLRLQVEKMRTCSARRKLPTKKTYIKLKTLRVKDIFGLEPIAFDFLGPGTQVTLVSEGSECILINSKFFRKFISQRFAKTLRQEIRPFPEDKDLLNKFQCYQNWNAFRQLYTDYCLYSIHPEHTNSALY